MSPAPHQPEPTDGALVVALTGVVIDAHVHGLKEDKDIEAAEAALLARLASLAQQVEKLNSDLYDAEFERSHFRLDSIELDKVKGERDALREALESVEFSGHQGKCPSCWGWNMGPNGETPKKHTKDCLIKAALALPAPTTEGGDR